MDKNSPLHNRAVLVTGASGFIGTRLVEKLVREHGAKVTVLVRHKKRAVRFDGLPVRIVTGDIGKATKIDAAVKGQEIVFNLAYDFKMSAEENVENFVCLADACERASVNRIIHTSSIVVYDGWPNQDVNETSPYVEPSNSYQEAKIAMEKELTTRHMVGSLASIVIQPTIVYGPMSWQWTDSLVEKLLRGTMMLPGDGRGLCNAVYVDDVADAMILAAGCDKEDGERFIISGSSPTTWRELFSLYREALGMGTIGSFEVDEDAASNTSGGGGSHLLNPAELANLAPVRWILSTIRNMLGDSAIDRLRSFVVKVQRRGGPITQYPNDSELELYAAGGTCQIAKARERLGYSPQFDLSAARQPITQYIQSKYVSSDPPA